MSFHRRAAESLLAFWSETGVDTLYEEAARDRMAEAARPVARKPSPLEIVKVSANPGPGKELAWAADDLEALAVAIAGFEGCALKDQGARQAVCWRGDM